MSQDWIGATPVIRMKDIEPIKKAIYPKPTKRLIELFAGSILHGETLDVCYRLINPKSRKWTKRAASTAGSRWKSAVPQVEIYIDYMRAQITRRSLINTQSKREVLWGFACDAVEGKGKAVDGIAAIRELNKMDGDHSPVKVITDQTDNQKLIQKIRMELTYGEVMECYRLMDEKKLTLEKAYQEVLDVRETKKGAIEHEPGKAEAEEPSKPVA